VQKRLAGVRHRTIDVDGSKIFYREAGSLDAPVVLLPHGYPCSSFAYRNVMAALGDQWRLVAPDLPGFGYSDTPSPQAFPYTFDSYAEFLRRFVDTMRLTRYVIWLHDYGSQFGLRLAMSEPARVAGLVIQNADIYESEFGPKYDTLKALWAHPGPDARRVIAEHVSLEGFRDEFVGEVPADVAEQIPPDLWTLHWSLMSSPDRLANLVRLLEDQPTTLAWFPRQQAYLRDHQPATLIVWGPHDGYMPEGAARAYLSDLPNAQLHVLGGGHWLLETHLGEVVPLVRDFLSTVHRA
jgi:pimeloyl-ACP methyl ester carboxylesterase